MSGTLCRRLSKSRRLNVATVLKHLKAFCHVLAYLILRCISLRMHFIIRPHSNRPYYVRRCFCHDCELGSKSSAVAEMGDRGHNRHGPKRAGCCAPFAGTELDPGLIQCGLGRGLLPYQVASSSTQPFGHNRRGPKIGWGCAFFSEGELSPNLTKSPGLRPTSTPSTSFIHPTVSPQ